MPIEQKKKMIEMSEIQKKFDPRYIARLGALFVVYFLTAKGGLELNAVGGFATLVWPPTGIALVALLIFGYRLWPGIFLAAFLVNYTNGADPFVALAIGAGNTLEALTGTYLLRAFNFQNYFEKVRDVILFICFGVFLNTLVSATIGVSSLWMTHSIASPDTYSSTWLAWWIGDMLGALVVGSFLLNLANYFLQEKRPLRIAEGSLLFVCILLFNLFVFIGFLGVHTPTKENTTLLYLIFPLLIWAAFRFGTLGSATAMLTIAVIAAWGTTLGRGPFIVGALSHNLLLLQLFIGTIASTIMVLSAAVAERGRTNQELVREKNKLEAILKSIGEGVIAVDTEGKVVLVNQAAEMMLGVKSTEALGRPYEHIVLAQDEKGKPLPKGEDLMQKVLASSTPLTLSGANYYLPRRGTKFPIALTVAPIFLKNKIIGAIKVFRDITHEKAIDRAKSEFVSLASHQLRTPLSITKWYIESLLDGGATLSFEERKHYLQVIQGANTRMINMVGDLLNISRLEVGVLKVEHESCNLVELADRTLREILTKPDFKKKEIHIEKTYAKNLPPVPIDTQLMQIVLENIFSNAIKYTDDQKTIRIHLKKERKWVMLSVADEGRGIPPDQQEHVFEKFFRGTNVQEIIGTGLGLYIVKGILEGLGGKIELTSEVGKGTTVLVTLPLETIKEKIDTKNRPE